MVVYTISNISQATMANNQARAFLQPRMNSHPFEERFLEFNEAIKVGRAVARCKPLSDNAIFDCKVLSRNHALLWYDNGKFLLRDTRSSNGTFVNNHRLSPANEDSPPEELFSGDVVQFGVEVMESAKKMTHGCIVLSIKLYYPNGEEAIRPSNHISNHMLIPAISQTGAINNNSSNNNNNNNISQQQSFCPTTTSNDDPLSNNENSSSINMMGVVSSYYCETINFFSLLKEASQREQMLRQKLQHLEKALEEAHLAVDKGWRACIDEDLLLSRIETLQKKLEFLLRANKIHKLKENFKENSITVNNSHDEPLGKKTIDINITNSIIVKNSTTINTTAASSFTKSNDNVTREEEEIMNLEQQLQEKVLNYIDDKVKFELIAKDAIQKALQKEYLAFRQIHDLEELLKSSEDECQRIKQNNERLEQLNISRETLYQKQSEEMTQERLVLVKDVDDLKQANSQLSKQYENMTHESKRKIDAYEHRLDLASQQICDMELKDKQLANLRYQLEVVNTLYQQADESKQQVKEEVDDKTLKCQQLVERISNLSKENLSLVSELETHRNRESILCDQDKDVNICAIIPPMIILLTVLIAYLIGAP